MGQADVYKFLVKNKHKWWTTNEISEELKSPKHLVSSACRKLHKYKEIKRKIPLTKNATKSNLRCHGPFSWRIK